MTESTTSPSTAGAWRRSLIIVALCTLGIIVGSTWQLAVATPARLAAATPTAVAVVDLNRLLEGLAEYDDMVDRIGERVKDQGRAIDEITARIRQVEMELENVPDRNSQTYIDKASERIVLQGDRENRLKMANQRIDLLRGEAMRAIYRKISSTVERVGEAEGWDLILLDDRSLIQLADEDGLITGSRMNEFVVNRRTLYVGPRADITDQIITIMNNEYKAARR